MPRPTRPLIVTLDFGTAAAKAALIDVNGDVVAVGAAPYPLVSAADGRATQSPADWLHAAQNAIAECLEEAPEQVGAVRARLAGFGITGQMQDLVLLPATTPADLSRPDALGDAVLYRDTRAGDEAAHLRGALPQWTRSCGNPQDETSCAAMWLRLVRTDDPRVDEARRIVFGPAGYLAWALGLGAWCDQTTAVTTGLARHDGLAWLPDVAEAAHLPQRLLPGLLGEDFAAIGRLSRPSADLMGLPEGIPVVLAPGTAGTTTLGIIGAAQRRPYVFVGDSGWLAQAIPDAPAQPDGLHVALPMPAGLGQAPYVGAGTSILQVAQLASVGATARWGQHALLGDATPAGADAALAQWEAHHGRVPTGLLTLPGLAGERFPVADPALTGAIVGMTPETDAVTMYRGVLEGVAFALRHAVDQLGEDDDQVLPIAGGCTESTPWMRIIADVVGLPVARVSEGDATLVGAALATATALGMTHRIRPLADRPGADVIAPDPQASAAYDPLVGAHRRLYALVQELDDKDALR